MIEQLIEKHYPRMVEIREQTHKYPELGFDLPKTSALLQAELTRLGYELHTGFAKSGFIGILRGAKPGKTVMLRADMDALPIQEQADVPYASCIPGQMHACGHDGHMGAMVGVAATLKDMQAELCGTVVILFQPAEEAEFGGAKPMIDDGVLDVIPIDAAFSGHVWGSVPLGEIHIKPGIVMPSRDELSFKIFGRGGHGAMPSLCIDPVLIAAHMITAFQGLVARYTPLNEQVVLSICQLSTSSNASNVIPDFVEMKGTLRAYSKPLRDLMLERIHSIAQGMCDSFGGRYEFAIFGGCPALENDPALSAFAAQSAHKVVGDKAIVLDKPFAASEDFSYFSQRVPACYVFVGMKQGPDNVLHHNPHFQWDSAAMKPLATFLVTATLDYLNANK